MSEPKIYCRKCGKQLISESVATGFDSKNGKEIKQDLFICPDGSETDGHDALDEAGVEKLLND